MDFHTLSRKQLQALCKKNKIPANMTNVAMADSLTALEQVEGIEELLNDTDAQKFTEEKDAGTPACRTSTRRKPVVQEPESSNVSSRLRRGARAKNDEEIDRENKDLNVPVTPAAPTTRRRAPAASTRRKKEDEKPSDHAPKNPAASNSRVKATSAHNTRKSVRLLEKGLSKMNLEDKEETESVKVDSISEELSSVSQQMEDSEDTENGASSLAISTEVIEETDESEFTSSAKNLSKVSFVDADEVESVKVDEMSEEEADLPQKVKESEDKVSVVDVDETEPVKVDEISEEVTDLPQKSEESEDKACIVDSDETESVKVGEISQEVTELPQKIEELEDAVEGVNAQTILEDIEETDELEHSSSEKKTEFDCQPTDSNSEMALISEEASETGANLQAEPQESLLEINKSESLLQDMDKSSELDVKSDMGNDIQNSVPMLSSHVENESVFEMEGDSVEIHVSEVDDEVDASMMIVEDKNEVPHIQEEMISSENKAIETAYGSVNSEEAVVEMEGDSAETDVSEVDDEVDASIKVVEDKNEATDFQEDIISSENKAIETAYDNNQNSEEMLSPENKAAETASDIQNSEEMFFDEKEVVEVEKIGFQNASGVEEPKEYVEKQAVMEVCNEPSSEENTNVQVLADSMSSEGTTNAQGVADSNSPLVSTEAEEEIETTNVQSVPDSQSYLVTKTKSESETSDVQSSLVGNEAEAESETTDVPTVTSAPINSDQKTTDIPIQFAAAEVQSVTKMLDEEGDKQKENQNNDDLNSLSMRQLKKMLKNLSLDNNKANNEKDGNPIVKDVERKRTALQVLSENQMTASKFQPLLP